MMRLLPIEGQSQKRVQWLRLSLLVVAVVGVYLCSSVTWWTGGSGNSSTNKLASVERTTTHRGGNGGRNSAPFQYSASEAESYVFRESARLGYEERNHTLVPPSCAIWNVPNASTFHSNLQAYDVELENYRTLIRKFKPLQKDVRQLARDVDACAKLDLVKGGLPSIFKSSGLLSSGSTFGHVEPILPPLRNPRYCWNVTGKELMDWRYLVHDYTAFCRKIVPSSKLIFVDLGASLSFHGSAKIPILELIDEFGKFGFRFDHIYGFEITPTEPARVVSALPEHLFASYHWINVGVSDDPEAKTNPWNMIMQNFREEDFVVVKLDIDTPVLEESLIRQLLTNPKISNLIDVFYFEHHVLLKELFPNWKLGMNTTLKESMDMFVQLRELGIASHSWV